MTTTFRKALWFSLYLVVFLGSVFVFAGAGVFFVWQGFTVSPWILGNLIWMLFLFSLFCVLFEKFVGYCTKKADGK